MTNNSLTTVIHHFHVIESNTIQNRFHQIGIILLINTIKFSSPLKCISSQIYCIPVCKLSLSLYFTHNYQFHQITLKFSLMYMPSQYLRSYTRHYLLYCDIVLLLNQVYTESIYTARTWQNVIAFTLRNFPDTEFYSNKMSRTDTTTIIIIVLK